MKDTGTPISPGQLERMLESIQTVKDMKALVNKRVIYIIERFFPHARSIDGWDWSHEPWKDGTVAVVGDIYYSGDNDKEYLTFPSFWLFIDATALNGSIDAFEEAKKKLAEAEAAKRLAEKTQSATQQRRAQYEALKKEFGE